MRTPMLQIANPLDHILPNFTVFGAEFTQLWQKLLAAIWGIAILVAVVYLILGMLSMATASGPAANPMAHAEGRKKAVMAALALGCLAALAVIVGAVLTLAG